MAGLTTAASRWPRAAAIMLTTAAVAIPGSALPVGAVPPKRAIGDLGVFAHVPYPGNPGGLAVDDSTLWVDTSAAHFDRPFDGSSSIFAYGVDSGRLQPRQ